MSPNIRVYDTSTGEYRSANNDKASLLFYRDSLLVVEIFTLISKETNSVLDTMYFEIAYYQFADLKTNTEIHFKTFTDTATPIEVIKIKPALEDKTLWIYYGYGPPVDPYSSAIVLSDTIINDTNLKRVRTYSIFKSEHKLDTAFTIHYAKCDVTNNRFQCDKRLSQKFANGCPIQMQDFFGTQSPTRLQLKYDFIRDTLTLQEHKVFNAWEKYAKEHPAK